MAISPELKICAENQIKISRLFCVGQLEKVFAFDEVEKLYFEAGKKFDNKVKPCPHVLNGPPLTIVYTYLSHLEADNL